MGLMEKLFGDLNEKEIKKINKIVDKVEALDAQMAALSDEELQAKTPEFKERLAGGETLDDILPEAFAVCREGMVIFLSSTPTNIRLLPVNNSPPPSTTIISPAGKIIPDTNLAIPAVSGDNAKK